MSGRARLSAGRIEAFAAVANHLRALGLSAPEIIASFSDNFGFSPFDKFISSRL